MRRRFLAVLLGASAVACGPLDPSEDADRRPTAERGTPPISFDQHAAQPGDGTHPELDAGSIVDGGPGGLDADAALRDAAATASDAASSDAGVPPQEPRACAGVLVSDVCFYLARKGTDCETFCSSRGGFDPRTSGLVGTAAQGGSAASCAQVMEALGLGVDVVEGALGKGRGLGCHRATDGANWWLSSPDFDPKASAAGVRNACGCAE
jgi:hypothetical protein